MSFSGYRISDPTYIDKFVSDTQKEPNAIVFLSSSGKESITRNEIYQRSLLITTKLNSVKRMVRFAISFIFPFPFSFLSFPFLVINNKKGLLFLSSTDSVRSAATLFATSISVAFSEFTDMYTGSSNAKLFYFPFSIISFIIFFMTLQMIFNRNRGFFAVYSIEYFSLFSTTMLSDICRHCF